MKRPTADMLLSAYAQGIFPMAHPEANGEIYWYAPDPRAVIDLEDFHASRRLRQEVRRGTFEMTVDTCFEHVMEQCAAPRDSQQTTWISSGLIDAYVELHELGFAHSVEAWRDGQLAGGLYGVSIGGLFAGESMFHRRANASKVSLVFLVERMRLLGMTLLDIQFMTDHLAKFGAKEITKMAYEERLEQAIALHPIDFTRGL